MLYFPTELRGKESWDTAYKADWTTTISETASGRMRTLTNQLYPKWTFALKFHHLTDAEAEILQGFVNRLKGAGGMFWYKDYSRFRMEETELPRNSNGTYRMVCNIGGYIEPVLNVNNVTVWKNGVRTSAFSITSGVMSISAEASDVIIASYDYYLKCYITNDGCTISQGFINHNTASITLGVAR